MNQNINIREFLKECPESELKSKGILRGSTKILQGTSVAPLIELMKAKCVLRVEYPEIKWFLESNGQFSNPFSPDAKRGSIDDIPSKGSLFRQTNQYINPYYTGSKSLSEGTVPEDTEISDEGSFAYEEDLKKYLVKNISLIESGMSLYSDAENDIDGIEFRVDENKKRVDILAIDKDNIPVVIELKVSKGYERVIGQTLYYRNRVKDIFSTDKVRIIIIARDVSNNLKVAIQGIEDVMLFEYKLSVDITLVIKS